MTYLGKRKLYVIMYADTWDGLNGNVVYMSGDREDAINRFKWLYNDAVYGDFLADNGGEMFTERHFTVNKEKDNRATGYFYYCDNDGECDYILTTIQSGSFLTYGNPNDYLEKHYQRDMCELNRN